MNAMRLMKQQCVEEFAREMVELVSVTVGLVRFSVSLDENHLPECFLTAG